MLNFVTIKLNKLKKVVDIKNWCNTIRNVGEETAGADRVPEGAEGITEVPYFRGTTWGSMKYSSVGTN